MHTHSSFTLLAGWAAGTSARYIMTIFLLGENPIQTIVQANWNGKKFTFKTLSISCKWYNKKMKRNQSSNKEKICKFPSIETNRLKQHEVGMGLTGLDIARLQSWDPLPSCVACFGLLTTQEQSQRLWLSLFSHKPTPPSPTWTKNAHSIPSTAELLQGILSKFATR